MQAAILPAASAPASALGPYFPFFKNL